MDGERRPVILATALMIGLLVGTLLFLVFILPSAGNAPHPPAPSGGIIQPSVRAVYDTDNAGWLQFRAGGTRRGKVLKDVLKNPTVFKFSTGGDIMSSPAVDGNRIFFGSLDCRLYCVQWGTEPKILWSFKAGHKIFSSPALIPGKKVYTGASDGKLYALDYNGKLLWTFKTGGPVTSSPLADERGNVAFQSSDGYVYYLDCDGRMLWKAFTGPQTSEVNPSVSMDLSGSILAPSESGRLCCFDRKGRRMWGFKASGPILSTPAVLEDGRIIIASVDKNIYCLLPGGKMLWRFTADGPVESSPAVGSDRIFIGTSAGSIICLDFSGRLLWSFPAGGPVNSSPAADSEDGVIIGCEDGSVLSLSKDGRLRWKIMLKGPVFSSPALGLGFAAVGCEDDCLYILK